MTTRPVFRVSPYRFTDHPAATRDLLETIGLRPVTTRGGFATMRGVGGIVGVHAVADAVSTTAAMDSLVLETDDAVTATAALVADGLDARWWDEAWGRQAAVVGPHGVEITLNESPADTYGYRTHDEPPADVEVVGVLFTHDLDAWSTFFTRLGYAGHDGHDPRWRELRGADGSGAVGLHLADESRAEGECALALQVAEPLPGLAARLRSAGHAVDERESSIVVPTPDGEPLEVHARG